ncbi:protein kinase family protein [Candidatus Parcubacteria bacterium]|uniref:Serine/threonine protein kinase n=1 Tax=Candidatus Magasanikbacteria bacterium CG10_big_fil_rev_8_21_14_0_10_38_6 TaxID=1974647 RepID=A0A2M6NZS7_9BACT|nr:protein kinase family protein [Candidatus Parcubacteria bacterium]PIR76975.1 MAG: serine/threonine protein kinase [Candidatus Magasanikbacteria bacterium CG10_big_fil_rev_8_21_14_0_10_38_6]
MLKITTFGLKEGYILSGRYCVVKKLGKGWEGEVYLVQEKGTKIERSVKIFFPQRNKGNKNLLFYAKKLHKLKDCDMLIQYHTQEMFVWKGMNIPYLVSEFVVGEMLSTVLKRQPNHRMRPFQAVHMLYALVKGVEKIHKQKEYHGDLHTGNIMVERYGLTFELKLVDLFHWRESTTPENIQDDICDMIRIFYDAIGGKEWYAKQPLEVKEIICGLKRSLILKKFRTSTKLREYLEELNWQI